MPLPAKVMRVFWYIFTSVSDVKADGEVPVAVPSMELGGGEGGEVGGRGGSGPGEGMGGGGGSGGLGGGAGGGGEKPSSGTGGSGGGMLGGRGHGGGMNGGAWGGGAGGGGLGSGAFGGKVGGVDGGGTLGGGAETTVAVTPTLAMEDTDAPVPALLSSNAKVDALTTLMTSADEGEPVCSPM